MALTDEARRNLEARAIAVFDESSAVLRGLAAQADVVVSIAEAIASSLVAGGKLLLCGNGGSAADAQHLAAELLVRLRPNVNREPWPALALATEAPSLTAWGNDYEFDGYYERMTRAFGRPGDVLVGITTSGRSENVLRALRAARVLDLVTVGLLGGDGGRALQECDHAIVVPSRTIGRVQESHIAVGHAILELVEDLLRDSEVPDT